MGGASDIEAPFFMKKYIMHKFHFSSIFKILLLVVVCFIIAFIIVWPLWKFATAASRVYTWFVLLLILCLIVAKIVMRIKKHAKK